MIVEHEVDETAEVSGSEVVTHLESNEYKICEYPNGLIAGLRMQSIPGSKGVHVDVIHVLDLRKARFGRTRLAVQSALLDNMSKDLRHLLEDVGLAHMFEVQEVATPFGRAHLRVLRPPKNSRPSLIYETRSVYGVYSDTSVAPSTIKWLTKPEKLVRASEFSLLHQSDLRSSLNEVRSAIEQEKWKLLETGYRAGWWSLLPLILLIASTVGLVASLVTMSGVLFVPVVVTAASLPLFVWLAKSGISRLDEFNDSLDREEAKLEKAGDSARIREEAQANEEKLRFVGNLNFVVTPLMGSAGAAVKSGDVESAASSLCAILTESVMHAPKIEGENASASDLGLKKFVELFFYLGLDLTEDEEMALSLAYAALTGHQTTPLSKQELLHHMGVLNNTLFDCGILSVDVKASIDDMMNYGAAGELLVKWVDDESDSPEQTEDKCTDEPCGIDDDTLNEMSAAGLSGPKATDEENPTVQEESPLLEAETVQVTLECADGNDHSDGSVGSAEEEVPGSRASSVSGSKSKEEKREREAIEA
jgi:hypothetical protein